MRINTNKKQNGFPKINPNELDKLKKSADL